MVSPSTLFFSDLHTKPSDLVYTLVAAPRYGQLTIASHSYQAHAINVTHKFSQDDIIQGRVSFDANKEIGPKEVQDFAIFNITDQNNNVHTNQVNNIHGYFFYDYTCWSIEMYIGFVAV